MNASSTVVFADLTGSTGIFETLGNAKATQAVTRLTHWIGQVCQSHHGRVVKLLGDGVLAVFPEGRDALKASIELQRSHHTRIQTWPESIRMHLKIGVASGEVVEVDSDCYGEAVNLASRLSDMAGADAVWVTERAIHGLRAGDAVRHRDLGLISIRGLAEPHQVFQVEWNDEIGSEMLTVQSMLAASKSSVSDALPGSIELTWLDVNAEFKSRDLPIHLGRVPEVNFVVNDPRVSRMHARIDWVNNAFVLTDISSYGTWVRFAGSNTELPLRRGECLLHGQGEIALGAPFSDFTAPMVSFSLSEGRVDVADQA
jgi:class 3 adenylate cyclase